MGGQAELSSLPISFSSPTSSAMASLLVRRAAMQLRRPLLASSIRQYSEPTFEDNVKTHEGKVVVPDAGFPDELGHSVGKKRFELLSEKAGHPDPFENMIWATEEGTRENPTRIPSNTWNRVIAHLCQPDALSYAHLHLHKGEKKRCSCGHWFTLVDDAEQRNHGLVETAHHH